MKLNLPENNKPRIEMLPLIDVVFLLLVVFIYTMLSMAVHKGMPIALPESSQVIPEKDTVLSVSINEDSQLFVNKIRVDLEHLTQNLEQKIKTEKKPEVLVFADKGISYQYLFKVLDRIRMAGVNQISLQAEPEDLNLK